MESFRKQADVAAAFIRSRLAFEPEIGLILGTGLGGVADSMETSVELPYADIPHFPVSTAPAHRGRLLCGSWAGRKVLVMQGRLHLYEGYSPGEVSFPVRVMALLGIRTLIVSNAAGAINPDFRAGDLMLIRDHINLTGRNPLTGPNVDEWGPRFPDMTRPYDGEFRKIAKESATSLNIPLREGVYVGLTGPSLETPAEIRFLGNIGADAVGMSLIMEVITAVHAGLRILAVSAITNENNPDIPEPVSVEEIVACAEEAGPRLMTLLEKVIPRM